MYRLVILHVLLQLAVAGGAYFVLARVTWEGRLTVEATGVTRSWLVDLGRSPAWNPPPLPPRERFEAQFHDVPPGGVITRQVRWNSLELEAAVAVWMIALGFTPLYELLRGDRRNPVFQICTRLAWTMPAWVTVSVVLWLTVGGWGPPCCGCCLVFGFMHGVTAGLISFAVPAGPLVTGRATR
jgi:hypothetical protein